MNTQRQNERDLWDLNESIDLDTPIVPPLLRVTSTVTVSPR